MAVFNRGITEADPTYMLDEHVPIPQRSAVAFVDILGYSAKVREAADKEETKKFLFDFRQALFAVSCYLEEETPCYAFNFTDSVVVDWPNLSKHRLIRAYAVYPIKLI